MSISDNLVSYYKLDESSGNAADSVGGNTLTNTGTLTYDAGKINNGAVFSSTGPKYLSIADASQSGLDITGDLSVCYWANLNVVNTYQHHIAKHDVVSNFGYLFGLTNAGELRVIISSDGTTQTIGHSTTTISATTWTFICQTYDASAGTVKFYKNGAYLTGEDVTDLPTSIRNNTAPFSLGLCFNGGSPLEPMNGMMDEVGIWNKILSSAEITALYNSGAGLQYPFVTSAIKTINGLVKASVKTVNGLATASVNTVDGLA